MRQQWFRVREPDERVAVLVELWHGDDETVGYMHPLLVLEVCRVLNASGFAAVARAFYPNVPSNQIRADVGDVQADVLAEGWLLWEKLRSLKKAA